MHIVIVDDQPSARLLLAQTLSSVWEDVQIHEFGNPVEALDWCLVNPLDLLILDYRMPELDGLELARLFRAQPANREVPIVLVTVVGSDAVRQSALDVGAIDVLVKPIRPAELRARAQSLLGMRERRRVAVHRANMLEETLLSAQQGLEERERETLVRLLRTLEYRDASTSAHLARMARIACLIAEECGLSPEEVRTIEYAAPLHDIGKIGLPDSVLLSTDKLNPEELALMRTHPQLGYTLLADSPNRFIQAGAVIALGHHEWFDGSGYPSGLKGNEIPLLARIVAVADVFDALISPRPHRPAWTFEAAMNHLKSQRGIQFDPACVDALVRQSAQLKDLCQITPTERAAALS